jgi:oligogalacturonide transporter
MQTQSTRQLSFWRKLAFGLGDIFGGGSGVVIGFYYLVFLTDVIRINPALAGTVILISKFYDAITDPFEGLLTDRTRTRLGRRKPYLLAGIPLVFLSFFLMWYPAALGTELGRFFFVLLTYLFFSTIVSIVMLSYNAAIPELTSDYNERTSVSSFRIFFSSVASIISAVLPLEIVKLFPDMRQGYIAMGLAFGLFYAIPFIFTVMAVRERPDFQRPLTKFNWREGFIEPFKVKTFVIALFMYLMAFVAMDVVQSVVVYFMKNYIQHPEDITLVNGTLLIAQLVCLPAYVTLSRKTNKRTAFIIGAALWMLVMLTSLLLGPGSPRWTVYLFAAFVGFGTGGVVVMMYAIFPDIPDVGELRNGKRQEGTFSSLTTFMRKLSSAFSLFLVGNFLSLTGYLPPVEQVVGGVTKLVDQPQSPQFLLFLRLLFVIVPLVFLSIAMLSASRFPLTLEAHQRLTRLLESRRAGEPETEALRQEAQDLTRLLVGEVKRNQT